MLTFSAFVAAKRSKVWASFFHISACPRILIDDDLSLISAGLRDVWTAARFVLSAGGFRRNLLLLSSDEQFEPSNPDDLSSWSWWERRIGRFARFFPERLALVLLLASDLEASASPELLPSESNMFDKDR
jgi:hypothetical protein